MLLTLLVAMVSANAATSWCYDRSFHWLSDCAYYAVDETWKFLLAIWVALVITTFARRVVVFAVGVSAIWALANFWPIASCRIGEYIDGLEQVLRSLWLTAMPPLIAAVVLVVFRLLAGVKLTVDDGHRSLAAPIQYTVRQLMLTTLIAAILLTLAVTIRARLELTGSGALLASDVIKGIRLSLIATATVWAVLSPRLQIGRIAAVFTVSVLSGLLMVYSFQRTDLLVDWVSLSSIQALLSIFVTWFIRTSGCRLVPVKKLASIGN